MDDEEDLVRRSLDGDHQAFARLVEMHQQLAHRVAAATVGPNDADDVVQDAFVKAYTRLDRFDRTRPFRPWLLGIVANEARNRRRAGVRYAAMVERAERQPRGVAGVNVDPVATAEQIERQQVLLVALERLSSRDREVVALRYLAELSEAEVAQALGCAHGTVKSRLHRAMQRLRTELAAGEST